MRRRDVISFVLVHHGRGHLDVVRWLVKVAGADVNRPNKDGCTPLLFACERGHAGVAQWLVREGGAQVTQKFFCAFAGVPGWCFCMCLSVMFVAARPGGSVG